MAVDTDYALAMSDGAAYHAAYGTGETAAPPTVLAPPWVDLGAVNQDGLTENPNETRKSFKRWGDISAYKSVITDLTHTFDITFIESNPDVLGLYYKVTTPTPSGTAQSEVQSITINGSPTGGDFVLVFGDEATTDLAYNATAAAVQSALQALASIGSGNITVTGSAGGPYTVTFAGALANQNVDQIKAVNNLTGGTSPSVTVATTTAGSTGNLLVVSDDTTGKQDVRAFAFDMTEGTNAVRFYVPKGEATARKAAVYKTDGITERGVTITAYKDDTLGYAIRRWFLLDALA